MADQLIQGKLKPELFHELLNGPLSTRITYARAYLCPCGSDRGSGNADPGCPRCTGLGYVWQDIVPATSKPVLLTRAPLAGFEVRERIPDPTATIESLVDEHGAEYDPTLIHVAADGTLIWPDGYGPPQYTLYTATVNSAVLRAGIQGVMIRREYQIRGEYDVLDLEMTIDRYLADKATLNPAWDCGESDRFRLLDAWRRHAQKVTRNKRVAQPDLLVYRHMKDMLVSSIKDGKYREYERDTDYTFVDGVLTWQAGKGPPLGDYYAVQAQVSPEYYVFKALPQLRHQDGIPLPRRIVLKAFENFPNKRPTQPTA